MRFIEKLKQFFKSNKTKLLPEPLNTTNFEHHDNSWIINSGYGKFQSQLSKLDIDINNFLSAYYQHVAQINTYEPINNYKVAYASLMQSGEQISQEQYNYNSFRESELLTNLAMSDAYQVIEENGFYHVQSQNYQMPNFEDMARVYVNCKSENISDLAQIISTSNTNHNFYMKFVSNESNAQIPRNEKIVIYCNKNEINYTMDLLHLCKHTKPELFKDSITLPFHKNEQDIASIAFQPTTNQYRNLEGQTKQIPQSANAFVTNMLQEAYMESVREIARVDNNLNFLFDQNNYYNETLYVQNYPYISQNYTDYLLNSMKAKLEILSRNNNIEIEGLNQYDLNDSREDYYRE